MNILLRESQHSDIPFLRKMLYEGVFWRATVNKPSFEDPVKSPTFESVFTTRQVVAEDDEGNPVTRWVATCAATGVQSAGATESDAFNNLRDYLIQKLS